MAINCTEHNKEKNKIWTKQIIRLKIKLHKSPVISISEKQDTATHNIFYPKDMRQQVPPKHKYLSNQLNSATHKIHSPSSFTGVLISP